MNCVLVLRRIKLKPNGMNERVVSQRVAIVQDGKIVLVITPRS